MALSGEGRAVYDTLIAVMHMGESDKALLSPQMVFKVLALKLNNWWKQITAGLGQKKSSEETEAAVI